MNGQKHEILYPDTSCNMFSVNYNKFQLNFQFECIIKHIKLQSFQVLEPIISQQRQHSLYSQHSPIILVIFWSKSGQSPVEFGRTCHSGHFLNLTGLWLENDLSPAGLHGLWPDSTGVHRTSGVQTDNQGECKVLIWPNTQYRCEFLLVFSSYFC